MGAGAGVGVGAGAWPMCWLWSCAKAGGTANAAAPAAASRKYLVIYGLRKLERRAGAQRSALEPRRRRCRRRPDARTPVRDVHDDRRACRQDRGLEHGCAERGRRHASQAELLRTRVIRSLGAVLTAVRALRHGRATVMACRATRRSRKRQQRDQQRKEQAGDHCRASTLGRAPSQAVAYARRGAGVTPLAGIRPPRARNLAVAPRVSRQWPHFLPPQRIAATVFGASRCWRWRFSRYSFRSCPIWASEQRSANVRTASVR